MKLVWFPRPCFAIMPFLRPLALFVASCHANHFGHLSSPSGDLRLQKEICSNHCVWEDSRDTRAPYHESFQIRTHNRGRTIREHLRVGMGSTLWKDFSSAIMRISPKKCSSKPQPQRNPFPDLVLRLRIYKTKLVTSWRQLAAY